MELSEIQNRVAELEQQISNLPAGSITKKTVNGKEYFYHRWTEDKKRKEKYIPVDELENFHAQIEQRKKLDQDLKALKKSDPYIDKKLVRYMCGHYFDIRTFGAVMTTFVKGALNCGQVRGPVQLGFAKSINPIVPQEVTITRVAITTEADALSKDTEMGRKFIVPYGLYRAEGFVSANLARKTTGFDEDDLALLWKAILNMFENDRSAARGMMAVRKLVIFKHDSELGNAPAWKLFKLVDVQRKPEIAAPRSFEDYQFHVDTDHLPQGVTCQIME